MRKPLLTVFTAALLLAGAACRDKTPTTVTGTTNDAGAKVTTSTVSGTPGSALAPRDLRIAVIVMENKEASQILGNSKAPYLNRLAQENAYASRWYGIRHPSLPNYLALLGGSTFGVTENCADCIQDARSLPDQLDAAGLSWRAYMEGVPRPCFTGKSNGRYAKKHNPFVYFKPIVNDPARCARIVGIDQLAADEKAGLANFVFITPDLCSDTHDCGVDTGDHFLARTVPPLLTALGPNGLLVVTYDEGDSDTGCCTKAEGGQVFTVFAGPHAKQHARVDDQLNHYSLLRTIEDLFGLDHLGDAACDCTKNASGLLRVSGG
jgi:hypothetical protein